MYAEIISGRRVQMASGSITYGEEQIVEALVGNFFPLSSPETDTKQIETEDIVGQLFDALEEKNAEVLQEKLDDELATNSDLSSQIERLSLFLLRHVPGEPSENEGAVDTAIRVIQNLQSQLAAKDTLNNVLKTEIEARTASCIRIDQSMRKLLTLIPPQRLDPPQPLERAC